MIFCQTKIKSLESPHRTFVYKLLHESLKSKSTKHKNSMFNEETRFYSNKQHNIHFSVLLCHKILFWCHDGFDTETSSFQTLSIRGMIVCDTWHSYLPVRRRDTPATAFRTIIIGTLPRDVCATFVHVIRVATAN